MNVMLRTLIAGWVVMLVASATLGAQAGATAQIGGTVKDESGGVLPGVDIMVTQTATGATRTAVSDADGGYTLTNLPIGPYRLEATLQGFRSYIQTGIVLQVNANPTVNVVMALGAVSEQITVQANAAMVETRSTSVGQVMENKSILELPLNGRQVTDLLLLSPGVTPNGSAGVAGGFASNRNYPTLAITVAGGSPGSTLYLMDGATHNDPGTNLNLAVPFPDALQEFKIETSALPARYGHHASAVVNVATKAGSNQFHGSAFEFIRDGRFNAKNAFALTKDSLKRNQFGGAAGGPVIPNKLFFFGAYQGTIIHTAPSTLTAFTPTAQMLSGDFTALASPACNSGRQVALRAPFVNNQVSPAQFDPIALKYLAYIPVSTDPCGRYQYGYPTPSTDNQVLGRVDYQRSSKHAMFGRFMNIRYKLPYYFDGKNALTTPSNTLDNLGRSMVFSDSYTFTSTVINSFRLTTIRSGNLRGASPFKSPADMGLNLTNTPLTGHYTELGVTNAFNIGGGGNNNAEYNYTTLQFADDMDIVRGAHQIGFGVDYNHQVAQVYNTQYSNGTFSFDGTVTGLALADLLVGRVGTFTQGAEVHLNEREEFFATYVQDAWRVSSKFTMNAGLRWEPYFPLTNDDNHNALFDLAAFSAGKKSTVYPTAPAGLTYPGDPGYPGSAASKGQLWRFDPRVGVVYDPRGQGREVIRAAYGMVHDQPPMFHHFPTSTMPPWGARVVLNNVSFSDPYAAYAGGNPFLTVESLQGRSTAAVFPVGSVYATQQANAITPLTQHWNVTAQKQFGENWSATASYFGNKTTHMWIGMEINPAIYSATATTGNTNQRRALTLQNPAEGQYFASVTQLNMDGEAHYNGGLFSLQKRFSNSYSLSGSYTLSRCINDQDPQQFLSSVFSHPGDIKADRGPCAGDRLHVLNATAVVNTPMFASRRLRAIAGGWQWSTIYQASSGAPMNVTIGRDNALTAAPNQRPDLVGDWKLANPTASMWFKTAAFALPAPGTYGNLKRNAMRGPGTWNVDTALTRKFAAGQGKQIEVRAEAFNLFNLVRAGVAGTTVAGVPNTTFTNSLFGRVTTAADPRILQFAVKYVF
jgi:hypothetical protein